MNFKFTLTAGEDVVLGRVLGQSSTYIDAATSIAIAVTSEDADSGAQVACFAPGSVCEIDAAGTIAAGDLLKVTTDGKVVADNTPTTGEWVAGTALSAGASGGKVVVAFTPYIA